MKQCISIQQPAAQMLHYFKLICKSKFLALGGELRVVLNGATSMRIPLEKGMAVQYGAVMLWPQTTTVYCTACTAFYLYGLLISLHFPSVISMFLRFQELCCLGCYCHP